MTQINWIEFEDFIGSPKQILAPKASYLRRSLIENIDPSLEAMIGKSIYKHFDHGLRYINLVYLKKTNNW